ncbi:Golgi membrane exchange factor (Ric1p-Rgp1p) subunit [Coemansia sp. BCRC 34301]|nr:Golgi membrane exchange factor (Ric1p-Rgp1p) subunit [Coemansia sp. BCRC 34301]
MGLTITATFEKQGIYFAGDTLECHIRFANVRSTQNNIDNNRTLMAERAQLQANSPPTLPAATQDAARTGTPSAGGVRSVPRKLTNQITFPASQAEAANEAAALSTLDSGLECTTSAGRRYSVMPGTRGSSLSRPPPMPKLPGRDSPVSSVRQASRASEREGYDGIATTQRRGGGLAVFPSLEGGLSDFSPQTEASRAFRGSSGAYDGRRAQQGDYSTAPTRRQPSASNGRDAGAMSPDTNGLNGRLSTSSAISTPTTAFTSWLSFGIKQGPNPPRKPAPSVLNESATSEAGSSGVLSNLWRNISGGSNPPSRPATRTGTMAEDDFDVERLAIGFAEVSGNLGLSLSYIKPDQLELLMAHRGTNYGIGRSARDSPVGGGLGGREPAAHAASGTSTRSQRSLPLLISSPTVLFSELAMTPGESQTFSLKIQLPKLLPPSFRGRAACISYDLVIIAKRSMLNPSSHVVRIPFRVLARVGHNGALETFAFDGPLHMPPSHSQLTFQESTAVATPRNTSPSLATDAGELLQTGSNDTVNRTAKVACEQLAESGFLRSLLCSVDVDMALDAQSVPSIEFSARSGYAAPEGDGVEEGMSMLNIQAVCRKRAPVSFSLSQDGCTVASVWLPKRTYQLGDLVSGKIDLHNSSISVYQVSIWLESVETVCDQFSNFSQSRVHELTRKVYAEHHEFCRDTRTLGFSLASLPAAAASFASAIVSNEWLLRIELIIGQPGLPNADMQLSAVSSFPPSRQQQQQQQLRSPIPFVPLSPRQHSAVPAASPTLAKPVLPAQANGSVGRANRLRSATVVGNVSHQLPLLHTVSPPVSISAAPARTSLSGPRTAAAELASIQTSPPLHMARPRQSAEHSMRTIRRRYDVVEHVPAQTLSCTVTVQMHPSLSKSLMSTQRDSFAVSLTKR